MKPTTNLPSRLPFLGLLVLGLLTQIANLSGQQGDIAVLKPIGGEALTGGKNMHITWISSGLKGTVTIDLWDGHSAEYILIASALPIKDRQFSWIIPSMLSGDKFRLRITSDTDTRITAMSATFFSISADRRPSPGPGTTSTDARIQLSPNPADKQLFVSWQAGIQPRSLTIVDMMGMRLDRQTAPHAQRTVFDLNDLPAGTYIVETILQDGTVERSKFIKQH